jgi:hypothetical protein
MKRIKKWLCNLICYIIEPEFWGGRVKLESEAVDRLLLKLMKDNPPIEFTTDCTVKFKGYPRIWVCNYPHASYWIYDDVEDPELYDTIPSKCVTLKFKWWLDRKLREHKKQQKKTEVK